MTHFTDIELHRWRDAGPGSDRDRIVAHLAQCGDCAARYADAIRSRPLAGDAGDADDAAEFAEVGRRIGGAGSTPWWKRPRVVGPLAAAAAIIVALVVPRMTSREAPPTATLRGANVSALAPSGTVDRTALEFAWATGVSAPRYRIEVGDDRGVVYTAEAATSPLRPPAAALDVLRPGGAYWWTVTAIDQDGAVIARSERRAFALRAP
jgi:hypothetical protein